MYCDSILGSSRLGIRFPFNQLTLACLIPNNCTMFQCFAFLNSWGDAMKSNHASGATRHHEIQGQLTASPSNQDSNAITTPWRKPITIFTKTSGETPKNSMNRNSMKQLTHFFATQLGWARLLRMVRPNYSSCLEIPSTHFPRLLIMLNWNWAVQNGSKRLAFLVSFLHLGAILMTT